LPKLLIIKKYVFLIYSSDLSEKRKHVHVESKKEDLEELQSFG